MCCLRKALLTNSEARVQMVGILSVWRVLYAVSICWSLALFFALWHDLRQPVESFVHHKVSSLNISRRVDLESQNFLQISIPTCSTATPDMTSLSTSGRKLSRSNYRKCHLRRLWVEFLQNGLREDHKIILSTYRAQLVSWMCWIWCH